MDTTILTRLNHLKGTRQAAVVVTQMATGNSTLLEEADLPDTEIGQRAGALLRSGKSALHTISDDDYFFNVYAPSPRIVVIGAVHISQALAAIARTVGFDLEIIDPRTAFATEDRFRDVTLYADWPADILAKNPLDGYTALVAVTHDPKIDDFALLEALRAECFYIGALGSRKTHAARVERLEAEGATKASLAKIAAPIGLDIGASNPAEIAVAIMAEIIESFRKRTVGSSARKSAA